MKNHPQDCYCDHKKENFFVHSIPAKKSNIPDGYCGLCDICDAPGHIRPFPGSSPSTGGWCNVHYNMAAWVAVQGRYGFFVWCFLTIILIMTEIFKLARYNVWILMASIIVTIVVTYVVQTLIYFRLMKPTKRQTNEK